MAQQNLFSRAVGYHLPSAIPTQLERIDEFALGKVLIYHKKPRKFMPWRKHELNFTGWSLTSLLAEGEELKFATASNFLFDAGKGTNTVDVHLELDAELKDSLLQMDMKLQTKDEKRLTVTADVGEITHISTDLYPLLSSKTIKLNTSNPIVREAIHHGETIFVISTLYAAERCNISVTITDKSDDIAHGALTPSGTGADATAGYDDSQSSSTVCNRSQQTPIAFLLLKLNIGHDGSLYPSLRTGLGHITKSSIEWASLGGVNIDPSILTAPRINPLDSVVDFREWVMVDFAKEEKRDESQEKAEDSKATQKEEERKTEVQETSPTVPETQPESGSNSASAPVVSGATAKDSEIKHPYAVPMEPVQPQVQREGTDAPPTLERNYSFGLNDFQAFTSSTYEGVTKEVKQWMEPVLSNQQLQKVFLEYTKPPHTFEKLEKLSDYLQKLGDTLRLHKDPPVNTNVDFNPVLQAFSPGWRTQMEEITALTLATEACMEFPQHTLKNMFALQQDRRDAIFDLIKHTPYGTSRHVFIDEGPFKDPVLSPILNKMGYSCPGKNLLYTAPEDNEEDLLASAIIVLEVSSPPPSSSTGASGQN